MDKFDGWTYGAEHELADWDRSKPLPEGFGIDERDVTIVNSNGIAADPKGKLYGFGGEINTPPTRSAIGQAHKLWVIKDHLPEATVNYRSNLHVHIHVPGLADSLPFLKKVSTFNRVHLRRVLSEIEPIPDPSREEWPSEEWRVGALRRYNRRKVSHHTVLTEQRYEKQQAARTVQEFFAAEAPRRRSDGAPMWHLAPRCAVNLRQLMQTDTVEFRHFPGTLDETELLNAVTWCQLYLYMALYNPADPMELVDQFRRSNLSFPKFPRYDHDMETRYRLTCHDGTLSKQAIKSNIALILDGEMPEVSPK